MRKGLCLKKNTEFQLDAVKRKKKTVISLFSPRTNSNSKKKYIHALMKASR